MDAELYRVPGVSGADKEIAAAISEGNKSIW